MKLTRCDRGHFYDGEKFSVCPQCGVADDAVTGAYEDNGVPPTRPEGAGKKDDEKTIRKGKIKKTDILPVVGWLVCVEGEHIGEDFRLKAGGNFVGRSTDMDVCLSKDKSVSSVKHLKVTYDSKASKFYITPGESKELAYLNGNVILESKEISAYDTIELGGSKLLFVPFCSANFNWETE